MRTIVQEIHDENAESYLDRILDEGETSINGKDYSWSQLIADTMVGEVCEDYDEAVREAMNGGRISPTTQGRLTKAFLETIKQRMRVA